MSEYPEIAARFARETAGHEMKVLHDDGLYRHLRFRNPKGSAYGFDLITWPGVLHIRGDMANSYTFSRMTDMFQFFRLVPGTDRGINPQYWSQKLDCGPRGVRKYEQDLFEAQVKEYVVDAIKGGWVPRGIGKAVYEEILNSGCLDSEHEARRLLDNFEYGAGWRAECSCKDWADVESYADGMLWELRHRDTEGTHKVEIKKVSGFTFDDTWEWDFTDYDWSFLWACHAIQWGIRQYDAVKAAARAGEAS